MTLAGTEQRRRDGAHAAGQQNQLDSRDAASRLGAALRGVWVLWIASHVRYILFSPARRPGYTLTSHQLHSRLTTTTSHIMNGGAARARTFGCARYESSFAAMTVPRALS